MGTKHTDYTLYYKDEKSSWMEIAFPVPEEKEYELSNLNKGSQYQLYMRAVSRKGTSDPSDVLTVRTECKLSSDYVFNVRLAVALLLRQQLKSDQGCRREGWNQKWKKWMWGKRN